jgi:hypothetical protein
MRHEQQMTKLTYKKGLDICWPRLAEPLSPDMFMSQLFFYMLFEFQGLLGSPTLYQKQFVVSVYGRRQVPHPVREPASPPYLGHGIGGDEQKITKELFGSCSIFLKVSLSPS